MLLADFVATRIRLTKMKLIQTDLDPQHCFSWIFPKNFHGFSLFSVYVVAEFSRSLVTAPTGRLSRMPSICGPLESGKVAFRVICSKLGHPAQTSDIYLSSFARDDNFATSVNGLSVTKLLLFSTNSIYNILRVHCLIFKFQK